MLKYADVCTHNYSRLERMVCKRSTPNHHTQISGWDTMRSFVHTVFIILTYAPDVRIHAHHDPLEKAPLARYPLKGTLNPNGLFKSSDGLHGYLHLTGAHEGYRRNLRQYPSEGGVDISWQQSTCLNQDKTTSKLHDTIACLW